MVRRSVDSDGDVTAELDQFFAGFDGDNSTLEFETAGGITAIASDLAHRRLYGPFIHQLIAQENADTLITAGETLWPLTDHTGTIRDVAVLDDGIVGGGGTSGDFELISHRVYNSFGLLTAEFQPDIDPISGSPLPNGPATSIDLDAGFTGRFHDDLTGLTHHQNRWFDPQLGKWISEDPLGFAAGDINTTRYVNNEPRTYTDPTGLIAVANSNDDSGNADRNQQRVPQNANYAQTDYGEEFSNHPKARFPGETVDSIAEKLRTGVLHPEDVPIEVGEIEPGRPVILNTRSSQALERAGIPREKWVGVNINDDPVALKRLEIQLRANSLGPEGTATVEPRPRPRPGGQRPTTGGGGGTVARAVGGIGSVIIVLSGLHEILDVINDANENDNGYLEQLNENHHNTPFLFPGAANPLGPLNRGPGTVRFPDA